MGETEGRSASVRVRIAVGGTAVAAALGVGAFLTTDQLMKNRSSTADVAAQAPAAATSSPSSSSPLSSFPLSSSVSSSSPPGRPSGAPSTSTPPISDAVRKRILQAREQGKKHGVKITHPLQAPPGAAPVVDLRRTTTGSFQAGGFVRLVTARSDLTGQQELGWVAGGIARHGDDRCSQTFRLFDSSAAKANEHLLLCWRTSAHKSVVAAVTDPKGRPSVAEALTAVDKKWNSMA